MDPIIINGINVCKCEHFMGKNEFVGVEHYCNAYDFDCEKRENCYYKQLQKALQENTDLKHQLKANVHVIKLDFGLESEE